ncbi:MAG TPA: hypothetical protein VMV83_06090 [Rectinemataceae bacterium]|nr:hypothetical protein [Rectinemataceae bacterium]
MKSTSTLKALCAASLKPNQLSIHPNDGFDLGMMTTGYEVDLDGTGPAYVKLQNECPPDCLQLPPSLFERLGRPRQAVVKYDGTKLFIEPR